MNPDTNKALSDYFKTLQTVRERLKDTEEPVREATMKRTVIGKFRGILEYQKFMDDWTNKEDPNGTKTFIELRDYILGKERDLHDNNESLRKMGIANSVESISDNPRVVALTEGMGQLTDTVQKLQQQNLALMARIDEKENKDPSISKTNELLTQLLAQGNNKCLVAPPQDSKVAELEKQLAEAKKAAGQKNNSTKAKWERKRN